MTQTNLSVTELKGLSKPISKLIDAVQAAFGRVYEPTHLRRIAQAKADAAMIKVKSDAEVSAIKAKIESDCTITEAETESQIADIQYRAKARIDNKERRRQQNIESIVAKAIEYLPPEVNDNKVDEDWTANFFEQCQDVKHEEMQSLWAKLLAGEVATPGSFSLRALSLVKLLRKEEADAFTQLCSYTWQIANVREPLIYQDNDLFPDVTLTQDQLLMLHSIGLIIFSFVGTHYIDIQILSLQNKLETIGGYYGSVYQINIPENKTMFSIGQVQFTPVGRELAPIAGAEADEHYLQKTIARWQKEGYEVFRKG